MAQLISVLFLFFQAQAQTLTLLNQQSYEVDHKFQDIQMGGLSGLHYKDGVLWALSDDRGGKAGEPRIYKFDLSSSEDKKTWTVKPTDMLYLGEAKGYKVLDPEAVHMFANGQLLISSEGDLNKKPRVMPMIRYWNPSDKKWGKEFTLPRDVIPEKTGMQTKGILNNAGFEAMAVSEDEKKLWIMPEQALFQSKKSEIEIFEYSFDKKWKLTKRYDYIRDVPPEGKVEVLRGMSEALWWKENQLLVLERYLRIEGADLKSVAAELFSVKLVDGKVEKKKLLTLDKDLEANWEGLSWGPALADGSRLLIVVSDNNFAKGNATRFLFYSFKE